MPRTEVTRGQVDAAAAALGLILRLDRPADAILHGWFRESTRLGSHDRGFVAESAFTVLRHLRRLEHIAGRREARALLLVALVFVQGRQVRALEHALRSGEGAWLAELKQHQGKTPVPQAVRLSVPEWLWDRLSAEFGEDHAIAIGASLLEPAPLDLRVNTLLARREVVLEQLRATGIEAAATPLSPFGIRLHEKTALERHTLFTGGAVEVQDEGSQLVALLMQPRRGQMIVDFCAGAGGKTLAMGALMRSEGRLYAFDVSERRLANLRPRLKRSGLSNVHPQVIESENDTRVKRLAGKIDGVLVDAPCSGTGTLRRNPDLKWRMSPASVAELAAKQRSILVAAARLAKPGGRLVYATCSLLTDENEVVVDAFLAAHPGWRRLDANELLSAQGIVCGGEGPYLRLLPHEHGTDGFFGAALERVA